MSKYTDKKVSEMVKELEKGVTEMFTSEEYKRYLSTMAKFYSYSINNCIMITIQKPEASYVAGYSDWNRKFERRVKAGEKGIRIFAPIVYKAKDQTPQNDPKDTGENEDTEKKIAAFKPAYVYDISQTEGKELPEICHELKANVKDFEKIKTAIEDTADCPVLFEEIKGSKAKGYYSFAENKIVLLSTHIVTDVEYIADEILVIKSGTLLKKGAESTIIQEISGKVWECRVTRQEAERLENRFTVCNSKTENGETVLRIVSDSKPCDTAVSVSPCLEDLYLYYFHGEV